LHIFHYAEAIADFRCWRQLSAEFSHIYFHGFIYALYFQLAGFRLSPGIAASRQAFQLFAFMAEAFYGCQESAFIAIFSFLAYFSFAACIPVFHVISI